MKQYSIKWNGFDKRHNCKKWNGSGDVQMVNDSKFHKRVSCRTTWKDMTDLDLDRLCVKRLHSSKNKKVKTMDCKQSQVECCCCGGYGFIGIIALGEEDSVQLHCY